MADTQITAKLSADASGFKSVMNDAATFSGGIANKMGHHFTSTRFLAHAAATALGLDFKDISEHLAMFIIGTTKEQQEAYKKIEEISTEVADRQIKLMRANLNLEQQYQLALTERDRLQRRIDNNPGVKPQDQLRLQQDKLALLDKEQAAEETLAKIRAKKWEEENKLLAWRDEWRKQDQEKEIADSKQRMDDDLKWYKENDKLTKELAADKKKDAFEQKDLNGQIAETQKDIYDLQAKIKKEGATENEGLKDGVILLEKQKLLRTLIKKEVAETVQADASNIAAWTGFIVSVTSSGRGNKDLSDKELARKIATTQADISQRQNALFQSPGTGFLQTAYDSFLGPQTGNLQQAVNEMRLREDYRRDVLAFGQDRAFQMHPGISDQRSQQILSGASPADQTRLANAMEKLNRHFERGVPFVFAPATGTPQGQITPLIPNG